LSAVRLALARPGATAAELLSIGREAARRNLGFWVGDPFGRAPNSDDSYVTAATAALATVTEHVRIGMFLTLKGSAAAIRLAEDINVIDQISGGRLDVGFVAPPVADPQWRELVERVLSAPGGWPTKDGRAPAVTPAPAQLFLSAVIAGDSELAERLGCGIFATDKPTMAGRRRRIAFCLADTGGGNVQSWLSPDPVARISELQRNATAFGAGELIFVMNQSTVTETDLNMLGAVIAIGLRASDGDRASLIEDAWNWATKKQHLHAVSNRLPRHLAGVDVDE